MSKKVAIIGAGPAGLFAAYRLTMSENFKNMEVTIIDKGRSIYNRICPVREGKQCAHCKPCNITHGFGGAGTFSDCKLSLYPHNVGGNIDKYVGYDKADKLAKEVSDIFDTFDEDCDKREVIGREKDEVYTSIENDLNKAGLNLLYNPTKHIGTDGTYKVMTELYNYLWSRGVIFCFNKEVVDFCEYEGNIKRIDFKDGNCIFADIIIFAPGRSGNTWVSNLLESKGVTIESNGFDIGYRVETPAHIVKRLTDNLYDMKIVMDCGDGSFVRTFCTNPQGFVSEEHYDNGTVLANGHSYADKKSDVTNFAVLYHYSSKDKTLNVVKEIIKDFSIANNGIVLNNFYKAFGILGRKWDIVTEPTLKSVDTSKVYPSLFANYFSKANEEIYQFLSRHLDIVCPGIASEITNIYGLEAKFYSDLIKVNNNFETNIPDVYCIGDGSGVTRGIIQSASSGIAVAEYITSSK